MFGNIFPPFLKGGWAEAMFEMLLVNLETSHANCQSNQGPITEENEQLEKLGLLRPLKRGP